jgi:HSP20 family protein
MSFVVYKPYRPHFARLADNFIGSQWFDQVTNRVAHSPAVNVQEKPEAFVVELAAPGMAKEDFKIEVEGNVLKVSAGQATKETEAAEGKYHRREFGQRAFVRYFTLPKSVETDGIVAGYQEGILVLTLPKRPEAQPKPVKQILIG